jgi:hypothetical protein
MYEQADEGRKERNLVRRELKNRRDRRKEPANIFISNSSPQL